MTNIKNGSILCLLICQLIFSQSDTGSFYVVKEGQTLIEIADELGLDVDDIVNWNNLMSIDIEKGQKLIITEESSSGLLDQNIIDENLEKVKEKTPEEKSSNFLDQTFAEEDLSKALIEKSTTTKGIVENNKIQVRTNDQNSSLNRSNEENDDDKPWAFREYFIFTIILLVAIADEVGIIDLDFI